MKKLKVLFVGTLITILALLTLVGCGDSSSQSSEIYGTYKFSAFVKMESTVQKIDGKPEIVYEEASRSVSGETYEMEGVGTVKCYENMIVLDLNKDNTYLLIEPSGTVGGQYGKWEKDGNKITLKGKEKDYVLTIKGDTLSYEWGKGALSTYTNIELKKVEIVENAQLKAVAGTYKFFSMTLSNAQQSATANVGDTINGKTYGEDFFLVDLKANGEMYILSDAQWGLLYGEIGTWTLDGDKVEINTKVRPSYDIKYIFTLSDDTLVSDLSSEDISRSLTLKK
ncbi:MAG: hypothetical protein E7382_02760 [Clostridiales bacterium]|nr:hypothetical protein [Clostridiales bacterium]